MLEMSEVSSDVYEFHLRFGHSLDREVHRFKTLLYT